jgi:peptidyl-prolyl cis-trans isomerase SurA
VRTPESVAMEMLSGITRIAAWSRVGFRLAARAVAAAAFITLCASQIAQAEEIDSVIASVDGEPITSRDVTQFKAPGGSGSPGAGSMPSVLTPSSSNPDAVLKAIITNKMLENESKNYADKVDDDEVDRYIANMEQQGKVSDAQLRAQLQQQGVSYDDFRAKVRKQVQAITMVDHEVRQKIVVPEAEINQYYKDNPDEFTTTEEKYDLAQILIAMPAGAPAQQVADAQKKADDVRKQALKGGADFGSLALQYSDDDSKTKGGELGQFAPDDINDSILAAIKNLKPGDISAVVRTKYGFHIVKVESHQMPGLQPLDQVRGQIRDKLMTFHSKEEFQKWVDEDLTKQHYVETIQP